MKYIQNKHKQLLESQDFVVDGVHVIVKDKITNDVSIHDAIKDIGLRLPRRILVSVDTIYVGDFDFLKKRNINAAYKDGAIFVSNDQDDQDDLVDDLIHEMSHSIEEKNSNLIYGDGRLQNEFLAKRYKLYQILKAHDYKGPKEEFLNSNFSQQLDDFAFKVVGYERLEFFTLGLFPSTYSVTSLREYFATGFEIYFLEGPNNLKEYPVLLEKMEEVEETL
mgnify:FL=1